jgi:vacuolar-type H+-ATPase subunit I/STV1
MLSAKALVWIERLIWLLIYAGLFTLVLGLATRVRDTAIGWSLIGAGAFAAAAGVVLFWVRSRLD